MTTLYVSSVDGNDANTGADWAHAKQSVAGALTSLLGAGPHLIYVDSAHNFVPGAAISWNCPSGSTVQIISVNRTSGLFEFGAKETSNAAFEILPGAVEATERMFIDGVDLIAGTSTGHAFTFANRRVGSGAYVYLEVRRSRLSTPSNGSNAVFQIGDTSSVGGYWPIIRIIDTEFVLRNRVDNPTNAITVGCGDIELTGITISYSGAAKPPSLFALHGKANLVTVRNSDLSGFDTTSGSLVNVGGISGQIRFVDCIRHANVTNTTGTYNSDTGRVIAERVAVGTITVPGSLEIYGRPGTVSRSLSRYRTGGADDGLQANAHSWEMAASADIIENYTWLESPPIARWVEPDASISGATAKGIFTSTRCQPLATPAALTTDASSTWNGTGVGTKQKIDHVLSNGQTLTVYVASSTTLYNDEFWIEVSEPDQVGGPVIVRCFLAKPSTTVYVDPVVAIDGDTTGKSWYAEGSQFFDFTESGGGGGGNTYSRGRLVNAGA